MNHSLLLFDIDATLLKSGGAGMRAMMRVNEEIFAGQLRWDGVEAAGNLDPLIWAAAAQASGLLGDTAHHQQFHDAYIERLAIELEASAAARQLELLPGVIGLLGVLRDREQQRNDLVLGLLTGNYTRAVPIKLAAVGIDPAWFSITAFGDEAADRPGLVELALQRYEQRFGRAAVKNRVIVIGDTPKDVQCARAHGCIAFGVATGRYSLETLREAGADYAVRDLADAAPLLRLLD